MPKICVITCYKDPDYIRAATLRAALLLDKDNTVVVIKNKQKNFLRYPEVAARLIASRLRHNHDIYVLTFRGYELLPLFLLVTIGKRRVFDEFINPVEWFVYEHKKVRQFSVAAKLLFHIYRFLLNRNDVILADTEAHAAYSARLMKLPASKFKAVSVSSDETVFRPLRNTQKSKGFKVFYYGNMLPLHGIHIVIDAALRLRHEPDITFLLVGGKEAVREQAEGARKDGAHITYEPWVPYKDIPAVAASSSLCLAGPFGGTLQASMVVTGKTYQFLSLGVPTLIGETKEAPALIDMVNCLIVPQGDAAALAQKIQWAYAHADKLPAVGRSGHDTYLKRYSNQAISRIMAEILQFR